MRLKSLPKEAQEVKNAGFWAKDQGLEPGLRVCNPLEKALIQSMT
jgi:hypothetical protein